MRFSKVLVAIGLVVGALTVRSAAQTVPPGRLVAGDVLVKFKPGVNANARAAAHRALGATLLVEIPRTGVHRVRVPAGNESAAIARYRGNPNVLYAEPNFVRRIGTPKAQAEGSEVVPGDYNFHEQWALDNTGQAFYCIPWIGAGFCLYSGTPDADIDAPEAWAISRGSSNVTVAVIDTGVDYTHPDLAANYAGGDDFVFGDGDPMDDHGHGTHVAGTIAASMDNPTGTPAAAEGVVGVAPNARILAYKVCRADGTCDDFAIQQAIARAVTDGANVINMSLGETEYSQSLNDAVQAAWNAGLVIVGGAGNDGTTVPFYPAAFDNVISVAAFDEDHRRPSFSNYGSWVDISAPGNVIMSTYPMAECGSSTTPGDTGCYTWNTGTSMATPHVSGAAALVWSRSDVTSNSQVVDILLNSADGGGVAAERLDSWTIHGGLNLHDAVRYGLTNLPPLAAAGPDQAVPDNDRNGTELVTLDGSASSDRDGTIVSYEWREGSTPIATGATAAISLSVGTHTLTLEVTDDGGASATDSVIVVVNPANQVAVAVTAAQANEAGPTDARFTVSRTGDTSAPVTVQYTVAGTALAGTDYVALPGAVTIEAGSATAIVGVTPIDDGAFESNESVILTLTADTAAYSLGSPTTGTATIVSDDLPPDLVVSSMTAPSTAGADVDILVTDTTKNQGTGSSLPSNTGFYLSANLSLDGTDVWLASRPVASLGPGVTNQLSTTLHIPSSTGVGLYYVLAKADWEGAVTENVETNNVRASGVIKIGPDLIVSTVTAPATAVAGGTFDVSDTTTNQGAGSSATSTTRFYLSANATLDGSDQLIGSRSVPLLAPGASASFTAPVTVPAATAGGTYYVIAQADGASAVPETAETNNTKFSAAIKVGPDLIVSAMSAPASAAAGGTISVTDTTKNQGAGPAGASSTGFYLSANGTIGAGDQLIGSRSLGQLAANGTSTISTPLQIPADTLPGSYYVIGRADWNGNVAETSDTNNDRSSGVVRIGGDLVVSALSVSAAGMAGGPITLGDTTRNQGTAPVTESVTGFYLSSNASLDATDQFLGSRVVGSLVPSGTDTASIECIIPPGTAAGSHYVIAVADVSNTVAESLESNNTRAGLVRIGPDLTVTALTAPSSAVAGTSISVGDTTKNQGADTAPASVTNFYLSTNAVLDAADLLVASRAVSVLGVGLSETGTAPLVIPASTTSGTYYIIAKSDGDDTIPEGIDSNNTRVKSISITPAPSP